MRTFSKICLNLQKRDETSGIPNGYPDVTHEQKILKSTILSTN